MINKIKMTRKEFTEEYPNLQIGDILIKNYESDYEVPVLISCDIKTMEMKFIYLLNHGFQSPNIFPFSKVVLDNILKGNHKITRMRRQAYGF